MKDGLLYYVHQGKLLSRSLADLDQSPTLVCIYPKSEALRSIAITKVIKLTDHWTALQFYRNNDECTVFVTKEGSEMESVGAINYCKKNNLGLHMSY